MNKEEILTLLRKKYKHLSSGDRGFRGDCERFIIKKFEELFESNNYKEGKISDRLIALLVDVFQKLDNELCFDKISDVNVFDLLMSKDYTNGKITEMDVIHVIRNSQEKSKNIRLITYDDKYLVLYKLRENIDEKETGISKSDILNVTYKNQTIESSSIISMLLSDNFKDGVISKEDLEQISSLDGEGYFTSCFDEAVNVLVSDNYKSGLIKRKHLRLFSESKALLKIKSQCKYEYGCACKMISTILTSKAFKCGKIKFENINSLLNFLSNRLDYMAGRVERILKIVSSRNFEEGKFSINYLIKHLKFTDEDYLINILTGDNFYNGLVTEKQIDEVYNPINNLNSSFLLTVLNSDIYSCGVINYEVMKQLSCKKVENSEEEKRNRLLRDIIIRILENNILDIDTKKIYISILLTPEVVSYIFALYLNYLKHEKAPTTTFHNNFVSNALLFTLPTIIHFYYHSEKCSSLTLKRI